MFMNAVMFNGTVEELNNIIEADRLAKEAGYLSAMALVQERLTCPNCNASETAEAGYLNYDLQMELGEEVAEFIINELQPALAKKARSLLEFHPLHEINWAKELARTCSISLITLPTIRVRFKEATGQDLKYAHQNPLPQSIVAKALFAMAFAGSSPVTVDCKDALRDLIMFWMPEACSGTALEVLEEILGE